MALSAGQISQMVLPKAAANYLLNRSPEYEAKLKLLWRDGADDKKQGHYL